MTLVLAAINAKYIHSSLAVRSLASYAAVKAAAPVSVREFTINRDAEFIVLELFRMKPDVLFFACYIWNINLVRSIAQTLRAVMPNLRIVLGGPEASYDYDTLFDIADIIVIGEGEETFARLVRHFTEGAPTLADIPGIAFRQDGAVHFTGHTTPLALADIPFAYQEADLPALQNRILYYESSRGCPFDCQYCLSSAGRGVRNLPLARVFDDLSFFLRHNVPQVKFVDRTFNCSPKRALAICRFLMDNDNGRTNFHFEIAAELLDAPLIDCFCTARRGLFQLEIGIQSTNAQTLADIHRQNDFAKISHAVHTINAAGRTHLHLDLIAGLPGEDYASFCQSFSDVYALAPQQLQLGFLKLLKGAGLRRDAVQFGIVYAPDAPYEVLYTGALPYTDVLRLKDVERVLDLFYNSGQFSQTLAYLTALHKSPFAFYEALADFWVSNNYHAVAHSRVTLYTLLHAFCETRYNVGLAYISDLLLYDLLATDNANLSGWMQYAVPDAALSRAFFANIAALTAYAPHVAGCAQNQLHRMCRLVQLSHNVFTGAAHETYYLFDYHAKGGVAVHDVTKDISPGGECMTKKERIAGILAALDEHYPHDDTCFLHYEKPYQLMIATILSAQCTDDRVNIVTQSLFKQFPTPEAFAAATQADMENAVRTTGYYRAKAKNIISAMQRFITVYNGELPSDINELVTFPGVGRKTANVVRSHIFNLPSVVVDTHVKRISYRLGLTTEIDPEKAEFELMKVLPKTHWIRYNTQIITHGRAVCTARKANCGECVLSPYCPKKEPPKA